MVLANSLQMAGATLFVFSLHIGVNIINRVSMELFFCQSDSNKNALNCSFLVLVVLFILLSSKPCHFARYCRVLLYAELLLQLLYLCWFLKLHDLLMCDLIPALDKFWIGDLTVYKFLLLVTTLYMLWFYMFTLIEFKINWNPTQDDDCGKPSPYVSSTASPRYPEPEPSKSCYSEPPSPSPCSTKSSGDCQTWISDITTSQQRLLKQIKFDSNSKSFVLHWFPHVI